MTYLDAAATAPLHPEAREAMLRVWDAGNANPSSVHSAGQWAAREVESAREQVAAAFGVRPDGVIFTAGGTEANNLGIIGRALAAPGTRRIYTTRVEHSSVLASCDYLARVHGFEVRYLPVDSDATVDTRPPADASLIAVGLANGEVGTVSDLGELPAAAPCHVDAVQAAANLPLSLGPSGWPGPNVASMAIASHKFGGPQGVGALILPRDVALEPVIHGGGQEAGRRSGTHNVAGIAGFAAAVTAHAARAGTRAVALMRSRDELIRAVEDGVPGLRLTGHREQRLPNHASFVVDGVSGEALLVALDVAGYAVSSGSACRAGQSEPSPVLLAMGVDADLARSALRFTLPAPLSSAEISRIVEVLRREVERANG
ncbi:cysteine desulfurase family protein [Corynebacterium timonense]|uniref:Cysteine desulfurase n=1 Tax=Corynebacterium timonense TaxID=441500 RepID=A0A1H1PTP6_9CORY|nr:cysteine desulfurase family protein [Corynebacterium timonense]SDS14515.1 cysteine desulfurase [Corynebacterium timonense]